MTMMERRSRNNKWLGNDDGVVQGAGKGESLGRRVKR